MVQRDVPSSSLMPVICATGWNTALRRLPRVEVRTIALRHALPRAVRLQFPPLQIKVRDFSFRDPGAGSERSGAARKSARRGIRTEDASTAASRKSLTHIRPPSDIIKVDDRLYYLLQPPLEQLLGGSALEMPFRPFPYQLAGVSFLFPRHAAILADEMGLGKTMQAITAIRLLLHAGELRTVLLICPKPLVANWQREFHMWAPEIPVAVIEGDQARRRWQWALPDVPVKLANYELLVRDRPEVADGRSITIWSCWTKPSGSRTAAARPARS